MLVLHQIGGGWKAIVQGGKISILAKSFIVGGLDVQVHLLVQIAPYLWPTCIALVISLVLILNSSIHSLDFDCIVKLFCKILEEVPQILSICISWVLVWDLLQDCCIFFKLLSDVLLAKLPLLTECIGLLIIVLFTCKVGEVFFSIFFVGISAVIQISSQLSECGITSYSILVSKFAYLSVSGIFNGTSDLSDLAVL